MKNKKFISMLLVTMLLLSCIVTGCGKSITPKECAKVWWEISTGDITNVSKVKIKDEDAKANLEEAKNQDIRSLKDTYSKQDIKVKDEDITEIYNTANELAKKATLTIDEVSNDGKTAEVKYKFNYIDINQIGAKASNDALATISGLGLSDLNEIQNKYSELYMKNLTDGVKNAKFSEDTKEFNCKFTNKDGVWVPDNQKELSFKINQLFLGQV